jgi:hypothetical protein
MSFDRQLDQVCTHTVVEEVLPIGGDQATVRPLRPIASTDSVMVRLNRTIDVPFDGLYSPAQTYGLREGPFTIKKNVNDRLIVDITGFSRQDIRVSAAAAMSAPKLTEELNRQLKGCSFQVAPNNALNFKTDAIGPAVTAMFVTGSTLPSLLGMKVHRQWRGKQIAPGWTLVLDPSTLADRPTRLIVFDETLKSFDPIVEVNYTTIRQECRRCAGTGVENDWRYGRNGSVAEVRDEALLIQEVQKMVYTILGSNPFHAWYGTTIIEQVGTKITTTGLLQNMISSDLQTAFRRWQGIKKQQEENVGQPVSDAEYPYRLLSIDVQQSRRDPTVIFVSMEIQNRTLGEPLIIERGLRLPQPIDLLRSTAAQGVFRESLNQFTLTA